MKNYQRVRVEKSLIVAASADAFFAQLMKWDDILGWPSPPVPLTRVELAPGSQRGQVPCTRLCYIDKARLPPGVDPAGVPDHVSETLLAFDPVAHTCLYMLDGEGPLGMRNYYATTEVDDAGKGRVRVTSTGRCDVPEGESADAIRAMLLNTYEYGVIGGTAALLNAAIL